MYIIIINFYIGNGLIDRGWIVTKKKKVLELDFVLGFVTLIKCLVKWLQNRLLSLIMNTLQKYQLCHV